MQDFKDNTGRTWTLSIDVTSIKRCRERLALDLLGLIQDEFKPLAALLADPIRLVDVCYVCSTTKGDATEEDFGRGMRGEALERAAIAFQTELAGFFPDRGVRRALLKMFASVHGAKQRIHGRMAETMEKLTPELLDAAIAQALKKSNPASGDAPPSLVCTPDLGLSTS